jgi:ribosomal protein S18 acetylase RimI-like enzyme
MRAMIPPAQLRIRPGRADEVDAIYAVHRDSVSALCSGHYTPEQIAMWLDGRTPAMYLDAIDSGQLWVAVGGDGAIAGFVEIAGREVSKLFVRGAGAGAGVGSRLMTTAVDAIRARGEASAYLESTRNACDFYRKHGFVEVGSGLFSRGNSDVVLEIVRMELDLTGQR